MHKYMSPACNESSASGWVYVVAMQTFRGVDEVAWLWGDQLYVSLLFWAPHLQGSICLPAALPDRLSLSPSLTLGLGGLLPTAVCSLWEISIAFELVIGSKVSDSHYYKAAFTAAAFQVASEAALSCHQSVLCGHEEDRFLKRKKKNQKRTGKVKNKGNSLWNNFYTGRPCLICFPSSEMEAKVLSLNLKTKLGKVREAVT